MVAPLPEGSLVKRGGGEEGGGRGLHLQEGGGAAPLAGTLQGAETIHGQHQEGTDQTESTSKPLPSLP